MFSKHIFFFYLAFKPPPVRHSAAALDNNPGGIKFEIILNILEIELTWFSNILLPGHKSGSFSSACASSHNWPWLASCLTRGEYLKFSTQKGKPKCKVVFL